MSTSSASIAQFMAILSGGTNPAMLRQNAAATLGKNGFAFESLMMQQGKPAIAQGALPSLVVTDKPLPLAGALKMLSDEDLQQLGVSDTSALIQALQSAPPQVRQEMMQQIKEIVAVEIEGWSALLSGNDISANLEIDTNVDISVEDVDQAPVLTLQKLVDDGIIQPAEPAEQSSSIWQFIQQQASIDSGNRLVLNLSEKGLSDEVIQELKSVFGDNDLITVIRDPKLNTQLTNALGAVEDTASLDTSVVVELVGAILNQNKNNLDSTLSFSVNENTTTEDAIKALLQDGYGDTAVIATDAVKIVPAQPKAETPVTPVQIALTQSMDAQPDILQSATPVASKGNPFTALKQDGEKGLENALNRLTQGGAAEQAVKSVTAAIDRTAVSMANAMNNMPSYQGDTNAAMNFADAMLTADGQALVVDGDYVVPFEASFKTASQASNPLTTSQGAAQSHQATQAVALSLTKMASKSIDGDVNQRYRLQLDPPEMGRIDIEMDIAENTNKMKIVITADKPEALGLLQRDMHTLLKAMQDAGFDNISNQDLSFQLSQNGEDATGGRDLNGRGHPSSEGQGDATDNDMDIMETEMSIIIDPITGQQSVNMLV